jgi:hypothetical protein
VDTQLEFVIVKLPSHPSLGDTVTIVDYAGTFHIFACYVRPDTGGKIRGSTDDYILDTRRKVTHFVYMDSSVGWITTGRRRI